MKKTITYILILMLLPLLAEASVPEAEITVDHKNTKDNVIKSFYQNESNFETDPEKSMEANGFIFDNLIETALERDLESIDIENASADEIARLGLLHMAYANDTKRSADLIFKAADRGNTVCLNLIGALMFHADNLESANGFITMAMKQNPYYLPALYNSIMLLLALNPEPDKNVIQQITGRANLFYRILATRCDPEATYSFPDHKMMEIITVPRVMDDSYKNRKYYMRGHGLLYQIRKVLPDYNAPVVFKTKD